LQPNIKREVEIHNLTLKRTLLHANAFLVIFNFT